MEKFKTGETATLDLKAGTIRNDTTGETMRIHPMGDVLPIVEAGGVFNYAREAGMIAAK